MSTAAVWESAKRAAADPSKITAECTDLRNAEMFVDLHRDRVRHIATWKKWMVYDGKRWAVDETESALRLAGETARAMAGTARRSLSDAMAKLETTGDDDKTHAERSRRDADRNWKWAIKSQAAARLHAMVDLARANETIAVRHDEIDTDPWLFNCENGTVDLRTGDLRPHSREDLITKLAPVVYDPAAPCPVWESFLATAMADNSEMLGFIQRMQGYALTGVIREHALGFLFGDGANGKSTYVGTIRALMGDYAVTAPRGLLFKSRGERHPTELTTLFGARFVACAEIEEGRAFDEALVKDLTGGDEISARRMGEDYWEFLPTHKLFVAGNHKPTVKGADDGIWRRIRLIPWTVTIPAERRDAALPEKLKAELPGILAWAVRGCLEWQDKGLGTPIEVQEATAAYREESDVVGEFLRLRCAFGDEKDVETRKVMRAEYAKWCEENGYKPVDAKTYSKRLRDRGVTETTKRNMGKVEDAWRGVRLLSEAERESGFRIVASANRDVGSNRDQSGIRVENEKTKIPIDPTLPTTQPYSPTAESEQGCFDDLLDEDAS